MPKHIPRVPQLVAGRCADRFAHGRQMVIELPLGGWAGPAHTADDDLPELFAMHLQEGPD
jgi:hypothetical protein